MNLPAKMLKEALFKKPVKCTLNVDSDRIYPCNIPWVTEGKLKPISPEDGRTFAAITIYMREARLNCLLSLMTRANSLQQKIFSNPCGKQSLF